MGVNAALLVNPDVALLNSEVDAACVIHCQCERGGIFMVHLTRATHCPACARAYIARIANVVKQGDGPGVYALSFDVARVETTKDES